MMASFTGLRVTMRRKPMLSSIAAAVMLAVALSAAPARAQPLAPEAHDGGLLDAISRKLFILNQYVGAGLSSAGHWLSGSAVTPRETQDLPPSPISRGIGNAASNIVNEPVTAVVGLAVGEFETSWHAAKRFAINATAGVLGWYDTATETWDLPRRHEDVGLILCRAGFGEGGYIVLPLIGPRTLRDGTADIVVTNAVLWSLIGATVGTGLSLQTIIIAEALEIAADIVATRQMDSHAADMRFDDYDRMRAAYLTQRQERCSAPGGTMSASAG